MAKQRSSRMSFFKTITLYKHGLRQYEQEHPPTFASRWNMFRGECKELIQDKNLDELNDVIFTFGCLVRHVTRLHWICYCAWPTVKKMAVRYQEYGCTRSLRNCQKFCKHSKQQEIQT